MYNKWKKVSDGMITVEASIVVPIVMLVITSFILISFWTHDIVSLRSGMYGFAYSQNKNKMPAMFVVRPEITKKETDNRVKITTYIKEKEKTAFLKRIINRNSKESFTVKNNKNTQILYAGRAIIDIKEKGGG